MKTSFWLRTTILTGLATLAVPAFANDAAPVADPAAAAAEPAAQATDPAAQAQVDSQEVTVTATRQAADKQKVGVALTVIGAEQLQRLAPRTLLDLQGTAPNVFIGIATAAPGQSAIYIRGQGYADVEKTQSPPVGVIQDGVFFANNTGQLLDMFNVCSVEVDRGPQGIFYGKNTTAGLINITRCAPTRKTGVSVEAGYGSNNEYYGRGVLNLGLGDHGGLAVSGQYRRTDGYYNNVFTGKNAGGSKYFAANVKANYDLTEWLNADFSFDHIHETGGGTPVQFGNVLTASILFGANPAAVFPNYNPKTGSPDGLKPRQIENNLNGDTDRLNNNFGSLTLRAKSPIGEFVSQTSYMREADGVRQDFDGTCKGAAGCTSVGNPLLASTGSVLSTFRDQKYEQFTQETRLQGQALGGQFDYLVGAFYYHHKIFLHQNTNSAIDQYSGEKDHSWSFFGNVDWNPTDTIKISGGLRHIYEAKDFNTRYTLLGTIPIVPRIDNDRDWKKLITRFAAQWQVTPTVLLYGTRSEGFRSGGFSIRGTLSEQAGSQNNCKVVAGCPNNNFLSYKPETNRTYEAGFKTRFFDRAVTFNAAAFTNTVKDYQQSQVVVTPSYGPGTNTYIVSYPKVRIRGLEFDAELNFGKMTPALEGLSLAGTLGIQKGKVVDGRVNGQTASIGPSAQAGAPGSLADFTGTALLRLPSNNYTIRGTYDRQIGDEARVTLTVGYSWIDKYALGIFGTARDFQPSYGLLDASATLNWTNYFLRVSGRNLTNKDYRSQSLPTVFFQGWAPPATFMVSAGAKF